MKVIFLAVCIVVAICYASPVSKLDSAEWENFKTTHSKTYETEQEELERKTIFMNNLKAIREHNEKYENGEVSHMLGMNQFGDMTNDEFRQKMNRYRPSMINNRADKVYKRTKAIEDLPTSVDWRDEGYVTDVKNQGSCGSCWAFSTTGSLEGAHYKKTGNLVSLSEQNLVDCALPDGQKGCDGYWMSSAFDYIISNKGIDTEDSYPYTGEDGTCEYKKKNIGSKVSSYVNITEGSEDDLMAAVAEIGPVSVAIDAGNLDFQFYFYGVYKGLFCSSTDLDHGVLAVGYGHKSGLLGGDYWLVKNSWGTSWGLSGYVMMARNDSNRCGIASRASYPIV